MKKQPDILVSIVTPVYKAEQFIRETIKTVQDQTYNNWELLLIDDCSPDNSVAIIKELQKADKRIKLFRLSENSGAAIARNKGIDEAKGRYIAFLDADDLWHPEKLAKQVAFMQENDSAFSFTGYEFADENGMPNGKKVYTPKTISYKEALKRSAIWTTTVMVDLSNIHKTDVKMPNYRIGEETATWWNLLRKYGDAQSLDEVMAYYRRSEDTTLSSNKLEAMSWRWRLYRKHEKLTIVSSIYYFYHYAIYAVMRRI